MQARVFETHTRVRYAETDATGIVYYANYLVYFELGRVDMFRQVGLPYDRRLPIAESHCRYLASAAFDDPLRIETFLEEMRHRSFRLGSRIFLEPEDGARSTLVAEGWVVMVTVDQDNRPISLPPSFRNAFAAMG